MNPNVTEHWSMGSKANNSISFVSVWELFFLTLPVHWASRVVFKGQELVLRLILSFAYDQGETHDS